jgi:myo-inositol-1(or 4)-monophosphatase
LSLKTLLGGVVDAIREAGRQTEAVRASESLSTAIKADESPVTVADRISDEILRTRLLGIENVGWLSEESADSDERSRTPMLWIVDPLDGTKEFIERLPQYSIAVALVRDGSPVLAAIHAPGTGITTTAIRGKGAERNGSQIRVSESDVLLSSRSEMKRGEFADFGNWRIHAVGSIALKMAMVGAGEGGVTLSRGPKWEWDVCAGSLIVEEAGGRAQDMFGNSLRFNSPFPKVPGILAGAPKAFQRAKQQLDALGPSDRMSELG